MNTTPLVLPLALLLAAAPACSKPTTVEPHPPNTERLCEQTRPGTYGVAPVVDATKAKLDLAGADELLSAAMTDSGCFKVLERARLELLLNEIKLCADDNPDRSFFRCDAFAKKGKILGVQRMVLPEVSFFEPEVKRSELEVKLPGLNLAGVELAQSYAAITLSVKVVNVETAEIDQQVIVHALVPSSKAGVTLGASGVALGAMMSQRTPMGIALQQMLVDASRRLSGSP